MISSPFGSVTASARPSCSMAIAKRFASRVGTSSQKSIWNLLNEEHSPTLKTLEPVFRALMISPAAAMTPGIDTSLLVSRKLPRLIEKYARMNPAQRDKFEDIIDSILLD